MPTLEEEYKQYQGAQGVNDMYEAQKKSQLAGLESAYQQNLSNAQAARDAIPRQYQERANDLAVQYERNRRNLNQQANANGLNTGAGSQMQLALGGNYNRDYGGIRTAQQQAIDQADRGIRDLQAAYNSSVQQAVADNDFRRTQALLADYQQRYQQQLQTAQNLANYGDFSGYAGLPGYSQEQIGRMQSAWAASNPQLAYNTGAITADQYYAMTGKWPVGYSAPGGGGWGDYTPTTPTTAQPAGALDEYRNGVQLYNYGEQIGPMPPAGNGTNSSTGSGAKATNTANANGAGNRALAESDFQQILRNVNNPNANVEAVYNQVVNSPQYQYFTPVQKRRFANALQNRMTGG